MYLICGLVETSQNSLSILLPIFVPCTIPCAAWLEAKLFRPCGLLASRITSRWHNWNCIQPFRFEIILISKLQLLFSSIFSCHLFPLVQILFLHLILFYALLSFTSFNKTAKLIFSIKYRSEILNIVYSSIVFHISSIYLQLSIPLDVSSL